jgi:SOS response regulatory protein OraA/RecX
MSDEALKNAKKYVLYLLSRRDYSRFQIEKKLKLRKISLSQCNELLDELKAEGLFKEQAYAKARTRQLLKKGFSNSMLKAKLKSERCVIHDGDIEEAFEHVGSNAEHELKLQVEKELRKIQKNCSSIDENTLEKITKTLQKKGHRFLEIQKQLQKIKELLP